MSIHSKLAWTGMMIFLLFLLGCGSAEPTGEVSGKATYKGKPVTVGSVSFHMPSKGIAQNARLDSSGTFMMPGALPEGTYQVYYVPPTPEPQDPAKGPPPVIPVVVPRKYHDLKTSNVSIEVKAGKNDIPVEFKD